MSKVVRGAGGNYKDAIIDDRYITFSVPNRQNRAAICSEKELILDIEDRLIAVEKILKLLTDKKKRKKNQ